MAAEARTRGEKSRPLKNLLVVEVEAQAKLSGGAS